MEKHTIKISEDMELCIKIPDIMDLGDFDSIVDNVNKLRGESTKEEKRETCSQVKKQVSDKEAYLAYKNAP